MFDPKTIAAQLDARVLAALMTVPETEPMEAIAAAAGITMDGLRGSMRRLALRQPGKNWPWASMSDHDNSSPLTWGPERVAAMV